MTSTQEHISIKEVRDDLIILKDGSIAIVLTTSAVNFELLSENEQLAIIESFAHFLNSLSFAIQIVIRSEWLDISRYLKLLYQTREKQKNLLLAKMIDKYILFIQRTVKEKKVLDKQFFVVIAVSNLELGIFSDTGTQLKKALTLLMPRRDHIFRQLMRMGLKATQLKNERLIKFFYNAYNRSLDNSNLGQLPKPLVPQTPSPVTIPKETPQIPIQPTLPIIPPQVNTNQQIKTLPTIDPAHQSKSSSLATPFIVEELQDEYTTV